MENREEVGRGIAGRANACRVEDWNARAMAPAVTIVGGRGGVRDCPEFTWRDEMDLCAFFAREQPPVPYSGSSFGAMLEQRAAERVHDSTEQPTRFVVHRDGSTSGAAWADIPACSAPVHTRWPGEAENSFVAYVDARALGARVLRVLSRLAVRECEVLVAHYGADPGVVNAVRRAAQIDGRGQQGGEGHGGAGGMRLATARRGAATLLERAQLSYARARDEAARWR